MNDHPYSTPRTYRDRFKIECVTPSLYRLIDRVDNSVVMEDVHRSACVDRIEEKFRDFFDGWVQGALDDCNMQVEELEADSARAPSGASKHAKRVAKNRKRTEGDAA